MTREDLPEAYVGMNSSQKGGQHTDWLRPAEDLGQRLGVMGRVRGKSEDSQGKALEAFGGDPISDKTA